MSDHLARMLLIQGTAPSKLETALLHQALVTRRVPGTLSASTVWQCAMADGQVAFHKPLVPMSTPHPHLGMPVYVWYGHAEPAAVAVNEAAAWRLARALGAPYDTLVATSVIRWLPGEPGIAADWGSLTREGAGPSGRIEPLSTGSLCDPSAFFDCLIGQQDRHAGNFRFDPATGILTLIDHGYSFPGGAWRMNDSAFLRRRHAEGRASLRPAEVALLNRLQGDAVWAELRAVLRDDQFDALERRRGAMLTRGELLQPTSTDFSP
ncbi:hypothetical protein [Solirubrobacter soli]|uniref:hypothetical protein n=1 Tax=Solirubrobacter soli TaxID=363832 RepID=UPI00041A35C3|nr:hypothetical protein [Solirubrobacter soli]